MSSMQEQFMLMQQQIADLQAQVNGTTPQPMQSADDTASLPLHSLGSRSHYDWSPSDALTELMNLDDPIHTSALMPDSERKAIIESYPPMAHLDYKAPVTIPAAERLMNKSQRLSCVHRFIQCFPSYRASPRLTAIFAAQMEGSSLPILHDTFWLSIESLCLYKSLQTHLRTLSFTRFQDLSIPRRLDSRSKYKAIGNATGTSGGNSITTIGLASELQEIGFDCNSTTGASWLRIGYTNNDGGINPEETPRHPTVDQTSLRQTFPTITTCHAQSYYEDSSSDFCYFSCTALHQTPIVLQESSSEIGDRLGSPSTFGSSQHGRTHLVVQQPTEMEWPVSSSIDSYSDYLCGRQRHRLGLQLGETTGTWALASGGSSSIDQLMRTEGSSLGTTDFPRLTELDNFDQDRQHDQPILHQQARGHTISPFNELGNRGLELVSPAQDHDSGTTYQEHIQHSGGHGISTDLFQESMANYTFNLQQNQLDMGPFLRGSICRPDHQAVTKVRIMDAGSGCYPYGCVFSPVEEMVEPVHKFSVELDLSCPEQNYARATSSGGDGGSLLAECSLVPSRATYDSLPSIDASASYDSNDISGNTTSSSTSELVAIRVAIIRHKLESQNLNSHALHDLVLYNNV